MIFIVVLQIVAAPFDVFESILTVKPFHIVFPEIITHFQIKMIGHFPADDGRSWTVYRKKTLDSVNRPVFCGIVGLFHQESGIDIRFFVKVQFIIIIHRYGNVVIVRENRENSGFQVIQVIGFGQAMVFHIPVKTVVYVSD